MWVLIFTPHSGIIYPSEVSALATISRHDSNIVFLPKNVSIMSSGYVYANVSSSWVSNKDGTRKHADHDKICIGVLVNKADKQKVNRSKVRMYKNDNYRRLFEKNEFPELPDKADSVALRNSVSASSVTEAISLWRTLFPLTKRTWISC